MVGIQCEELAEAAAKAKERVKALALQNANQPIADDRAQQMAFAMRARANTEQRWAHALEYSNADASARDVQLTRR